MSIVELIVVELRRRGEMLAALFVVPGQIVIHGVGAFFVGEEIPRLATRARNDGRWRRG